MANPHPESDDGSVLYLLRRHQALPGAAEAVEYLLTNDIPHMFLTNTTTNTTKGDDAAELTPVVVKWS